MPLNPLYQKIEKAKIKCIQKDPHLAKLLNHWQVDITNHSTAATDGKRIYFGEAFLKELNTDEILFVLLHELLHILLNHLPRRLGRDPKKFNIACDIVVNDLLTYHGFDHGKLPAVTGRSYNLNGESLHAEEVYDLIPFQPKVNSFDDHSLWESLSEADLKKIIEEISHKSTGKSSLYRRLIHLTKDQSPTLESVVRQFLSQAIADYTFERIDHRFEDVLLPGFNDTHFQLENIWIVIDVSGSMSEKVISRIYAKLEHIVLGFPSVNLNVSFFSNILTVPINVQSMDDLKEAFNQLDTTGGTEFSVIFEKYNDLFPHQLPLANIIITDGYGRSPNSSLNPGNPTWWVLTESSDFKPEFGEIVILEEEINE